MKDREVTVSEGWKRRVEDGRQRREREKEKERREGLTKGMKKLCPSFSNSWIRPVIRSAPHSYALGPPVDSAIFIVSVSLLEVDKSG